MEEHQDVIYNALFFLICVGCGMKLRSDDPGAMKSFIVTVQNSVNELKTSSGDGQTKINGKRVIFV